MILRIEDKETIGKQGKITSWEHSWKSYEDKGLLSE